jgi:hypothetical protein
VTDMACWITFFAEGARRNSSRWDLYSRLGDAGFLCADGMISLQRSHVRQFAVLGKSNRAQPLASAALFGLFGTVRIICKCSAMSSYERLCCRTITARNQVHARLAMRHTHMSSCAYDIRRVKSRDMERRTLERDDFSLNRHPALAYC